MNIGEFLLSLIRGGFGNLAAYLAAHVLLCLVPAFYIAGAMTALIPKETITRFLGRNTPKFISYPAAALAGSVLAVCSCTIVPLFAGIYKKGAGLGPAITFLFFAPAANILALVYTGGVIGADLAFARLILSLAFGIGIGLIMALLFSRSDEAHDKATDALFAGQSRKGMRRIALVFLLLLVVLLLSGTFKLEFLTRAYAQVTLPVRGINRLQDFLFRLVPFDPAKGEEGVSPQGLLLIVLLGLVGFASWKGIENIHSGFNRWTWAAMLLVGLTLLTAAVGMRPQTAPAVPATACTLYPKCWNIPVSPGLDIQFTGKFFAVLLALSALGYILVKQLTRDEQRDFLWESWRFVKQIFPLLIVGVFTVGVLRTLIKPEWIEALAGRNTLLGNLAGVLFGVFMYFPTLVEVPIAKMFLGLGMHRGPLLAYLMADPELSLQSILITATIIGKLKAWIYVGWVALFSTLAGLIYGAWVDGASIWLIGPLIGAFLAALGGALWLISRHKRVDKNRTSAG